MVFLLVVIILMGNHFFIWCSKHVLRDLFASILASLFFLVILRRALFRYLVNKLFYMFEKLFILVEDRLDKILSFVSLCRQVT